MSFASFRGWVAEARVGEDAPVIMRDIDTLQECGQLAIGNRHTCHSLAISRAGGWMAMSAAGGPGKPGVEIRDTATGKSRRRLEGHGDKQESICFTPDGNRLASASVDRTVRIWEVASGRCLATLQTGAKAFAVAFSPDGTRLVAGLADGSIVVWDAHRFQIIVRLRGHSWYVRALAFNPDGSRLVSASGDNTLRIWETTPLRKRLVARQEANKLRSAAEQVLARLLDATGNDPARVVAALAADTAVDAPQRHAVLNALLRRGSPYSCE